MKIEHQAAWDGFAQRAGDAQFTMLNSQGRNETSVGVWLASSVLFVERRLDLRRRGVVIISIFRARSTEAADCSDAIFCVATLVAGRSLAFRGGSARMRRHTVCGSN